MYLTGSKTEASESRQVHKQNARTDAAAGKEKGTMKRIRDRHILIIYLLFFFCVAASVALFQPLADTPPLLGNPPDEHARYLVPQFICRYGRIPTGFEEELLIPSYGFSYGIYNVFPYIIQGFFMRFVSLFTDSPLILLYAARFVNLCSGTAMAAVVYLTARKVFADRRFRWIFCFLVMFLPQSLFLHTYVNTDSMCLLSTSMMVYALVSAYKEGFTRRNSLWLCGGIILCALSYYNAYGYILSSILLFLAYFVGERNGRLYYNWKEMLKKGIFISVIVLLGIGWWFIRSYILYDGDILGLRTRDLMAAENAVAAVNPLMGNTYQDRGYTVWQMMRENRYLSGLYVTFVAAFGSTTIYCNIWLYRLYKAIIYAGVLGWLVVWKRKVKTAGVERFKKYFFHSNMIFCMLMPLLLLIQYAYTVDFQQQGRYLLPMIVPAMYYVTAGLEKLASLSWVPEKLKNIAVTGVLTAIIVGLLVMVYGYAFPVYLQTGMVY